MPYGESFNSERERIGLIKIDNSFLNYEYYSGSNSLIRNRKNIDVANLNKPAYIGKRGHLDEQGKLIFEEDIFAKGNRKPGIETDVNELLVYRYVFMKYEQDISIGSPYKFKGKFYKEGEIMESGWQYVYIFPGKAEKTDSNTVLYEQSVKYLNKREADSILKSWDIAVNSIE